MDNVYGIIVYTPDLYMCISRMVAGVNPPDPR